MPYAYGKASEARLRRFVADAGHELRTPLTAIQGYAQLALRPEQRPARELHEANRFIVQNAERMSLLVDDLQLLATLDKEPSYLRERVDLLSLAADAVSAAADHSASHPVDLGPLHTPADPTGAERLDVAETVGDPHRLRQILENLLSNARGRTPPAPGSTSASVAPWWGPQPVVPTGPGAPAPHRPCRCALRSV
ncbi:histidine kinase dimerization/phospho-acceptor domain-containing protein [Streptomyces canus]|uniref:histidine kinase dimerization/phospho-acceptor domain-containing protein n=1 Tax=Streptomyces canus TaxID=58343 RepID=UPI0036AE6E29